MSIRDYDAFIRESAGMGLTMRETAECIGYHYTAVAVYAGAHGIAFTNSQTPPPGRNEAIIADFQSGLTLEAIVTALAGYYGWEGLAERIPVRCFTHDPSVASSLKFLRKTPWAREKVESLYLFMLREQKRSAQP